MLKSCKRLSTFFLTLVVILCITGCGNSQGSETQDQTVPSGTGTETSTYGLGRIDTKRKAGEK